MMQNLTQLPIFRLAFLSMPLIFAEQTAASTSYETYARVYDSSGPRTVCNDFFCSSTTVIPPDDVVEQHSGLELYDSNAQVRIGLASANASTRLHSDPFNFGSIKIGASASGQRSGYHLGEAHAVTSLDYRIQVNIAIPTDPIIGPLATSLCAPPLRGCQLAVDFQHQTTGLFGFSGAPGLGAEARFSETLHMNSGATLAGEAFISTDPLNSRTMTHGATGLWSDNDFFPPYDRTGLPWGGSGTEMRFNHFETIPNQFSIFTVNPCTDVAGVDSLCLTSEYAVTIEQTANAGFGGHSEYTTGGGVYADFAHTSEFSAVRLFDPSGQMDFSNAQISFQYIPTAPVPLPGAFWLFASALGFIGLKSGSASCTLAKRLGLPAGHKSAA